MSLMLSKMFPSFLVTLLLSCSISLSKFYFSLLLIPELLDAPSTLLVCSDIFVFAGTWLAADSVLAKEVRRSE